MLEWKYTVSKVSTSVLKHVAYLLKEQHVDDPSAKFLKSNAAIADLASLENYTLARGWLSECLNKHANCPNSMTSILPTRIIDVLSTADSKVVRLHLADHSEKGRYVALSYCWGREQPRATTSTTLNAYTESINVSDLPKTIQDAIECTRQLNIRYLWVDSLCIIQDSERDKIQEIQKMPQIYSNATVTLSAAAAQHCDEGFLKLRQDIALRYSNRSPRLPFRCPDGTQGTMYLVPIAFDWQNSPSKETIYERGWTHQERILSPRLLTYGSRRLSWNCFTLEHCDLGIGHSPRSLTGGDVFSQTLGGDPLSQTHGDPSTITLRKLLLVPILEMNEGGDGGFASLHHYWRQLVSRYTIGKCSLAEDKLRALSGIAIRFHQLLHSQYLAGLWKDDLVRDLMWESARPLERPANHYRIPELRSPSWSWASINGEVQYHEACLDKDLYIKATIEECTVHVVTDLAPFGEVSGGCLAIRSRLCQMSWTQLKQVFQERTTLTRAEPPHESKLGYVYPDENGWLFDWVTELQPENANDQYCLFELARDRKKSYGLIVKPAGMAHFTRVGFYTINSAKPLDHLEIWDQSSVPASIRII